MSGFTKAVRKKSKLRLAIAGPSGSGKTYSALVLARGMGGKIAVVDTENGSAELYATQFDFDVLNLRPPFEPEYFISAIKDAEKAGYAVLVIDSLTAEWRGDGGCLQMADVIGKTKFGGNKWSAWSEVDPRHTKLINTIIQSPMHIICAMRSKVETEQQTDDKGKKKIVKLGMKPEQRDGIEYEFTVFFDLLHDGHYAIASKDRTGLFADKLPEVITDATGVRLLDWLNSGVDEVPLKKQSGNGTIHAATGVTDGLTIDKVKEQADHISKLVVDLNFDYAIALLEQSRTGSTEEQAAVWDALPSGVASALRRETSWRALPTDKKKLINDFVDLFQQYGAKGNAHDAAVTWTEAIETLESKEQDHLKALMGKELRAWVKKSYESLPVTSAAETRVQTTNAEIGLFVNAYDAAASQFPPKE